MKGNDFTTEVVPLGQRSAGVSILFAWMGFILVVVSMSFGGALAAQMQYGELVKAILLGNAFLAACAFVTGYVGAYSGLSFGSLAAGVFTRGTWRFAILYIPLVLIGWYAIEASIFANFLSDTFGLSEISRRLIMAGGALFFSISAYVGVRFIGKISYVLIPLVLAISLFALLNLKDYSQLAFGFGETKTDALEGAAIVMSTWIFSVLLVVPDLTRFIRRPLVAGAIGAFGVFIGNSLALGIGAFAAAYTRQSDPALILVALGFTPLAIILTFCSVWSTNDNNMYSSSLSVARSLSLPRRTVVLGLASIGAAIALFNPATVQVMFGFLAFMGASAPPLAGVVIGSYIYRSSRRQTAAGMAAPWIAWIVATVITLQLHGIVVIPFGILSGFILWLIFDRVEHVSFGSRASSLHP